MTISFTVPGIPAPQGSKVRTKWGMREDNPATRPWRSAVAWAANVEVLGMKPGADAPPLLTGPLRLEVSFYFPRPKNHFGTGRNADVLKESAPLHHTAKPDVDKLCRAIGDSLTGIVFRDDSQIAEIVARKLYGSPCAVVTVAALSNI